jgi:hypothetical protein
MPEHRQRLVRSKGERPVVPSLEYVADRLGVREYIIGNGGKHKKKKELK